MEHSWKSENSNTSGPDGQERIRDVKNGIDHDIAYRNNELSERDPVVVYLGLGTTALSSTGQLYLDAYAKAIERPVINIETPVRAFSSFVCQTESQLGALRQCGVDKFDVVGASSGAVAASYLAAQAQSDVLDLVTISIPNTRANMGDYAYRMPAQFFDGLHELISVIKKNDLKQVIGPGASNLFNVTKIPELIHTIKEILDTSLDDVPSMLAASTHWTDIAGTKDKITDYTDHLRVIRQRNILHPGSSTSFLVADQGHAWVSNRAYLADIVGNVLRKK